MNDLEKILKDHLEQQMYHDRDGKRMKKRGWWVEQDPTTKDGWMVVYFHSNGWNTLFRGTLEECVKERDLYGKGEKK